MQGPEPPERYEQPESDQPWLAALLTSFTVMRPPEPVPSTCERSTPSSSALRSAAGVACTSPFSSPASPAVSAWPRRSFRLAPWRQTPRCPRRFGLRPPVAPLRRPAVSHRWPDLRPRWQRRSRLGPPGRHYLLPAWRPVRRLVQPRRLPRPRRRRRPRRLHRLPLRGLPPPSPSRSRSRRRPRWRLRPPAHLSPCQRPRLQNPRRWLTLGLSGGCGLWL